MEGAFILEKLDQELDAFKAEYKEYLDLESKMLQEAKAYCKKNHYSFTAFTVSDGLWCRLRR